VQVDSSTIMKLRRYAGSIESVHEDNQHTLHFGCDGRVCADSSDFSNLQVSLSDLAFAMEFDASELVMVPQIPLTYADIHTFLPTIFESVPAEAACTSTPRNTFRSAKQPLFTGKEAWQELGHSLGDVAETNAITQAQIAVIAATMCNATLSASEKQKSAQALCSGQMSDCEDDDFVYSKVAALSAAHVNWLLDKPSLRSDSRGPTMWPHYTNSESILLLRPLSEDYTDDEWQACAA